jgi:hypothetical protein
MADQSAFAPLFDNAKPTDDQQLANLVRNGDTAATKAFLEKRNANQEALDAQKKQAEEAAATPEISEQESKRIDAINEIRTKPAAALANLHDNDDTAIVAKYRSNKELYDSDPVAKQRFLDAYKIARSQPFSIGSTIAGFGEGLIKLVPALAGSAAQVTKDVATGNGDKVVMAGILSAETTGQDLSKAKTNLFRLISSGSTLPKDDAGWQSDFDTAIKRDEFLDSTAHGGHVTHYSDKEAEEIQKDTLIADPLNFIPLEAGAGIITKVVKGSVAGEKVFQVVNKAREVIREIPVVSRGGQMIASMAKSARSLSENAAITAGSNLIDAGSKFGAVKGSTVGAIAEMAMRGVTNGIPGAGIIAGAAAPTILKSIGSALVNTGLKSKGLLPWGSVAHAAEAAVNNPLTRGAAGALGLHGDPLAAGFTGFSALVNADGNGKKLGEALGSNAAFGAAGGLLGAAVPEDKSAQPQLRTIGALQQQAAAGHAQNPSQLSTLTAGQKSQQAAPTSSAGYGVFPGFDKIHQDNVSKLTPEAQDNINKFRETFRETGAQIYVLSPEEYATALVDRRAKELGRALTEDEAKQIVATDGATRGVFTDTLKDEKGKAQRVVLLNSEGSALGHETGHLVDSLLMPEDKAALRDQVSKSYTPEQIAEAKTAYEDQLGRPITQEQAIDELIAENFTKMISGVPIDQIGAPREVSTDLERALVKAYASDTELGFKPDVNVGALISKTLANRPLDADVVPPSQVAPAAEVPLKPTALTSAPTAGAIPLAAKKPAPAPAKDSNIRVTPEQQNQFSETRGSAPSDKGSVEAELALQDPKNGYTPKDRVTLNNVTESMGKPIEAEYHSVKSDKFGANRTERGEERAVPDAIRQTVQKIFVPYRTEVTSKGIQVLAMSLDKVRQNIDTLATELTRKGATDLSPYAIRDGKFTDSEAFSLIKDIQTYLTNQESGFGGNGQKIIVPKDYYGTIPGEKPGAKPTQLSEDKAQFINALMGRDLGPPKTARATPNRPVPANVSARQLAEANKRPTEPSLLAKEGQEFSAAQGGGKITEMNPLRQAMVKRGVSVEGLHEITERLSLKDIRSVKARPDLRFAQPATDLIRAGFMPATAENKTAKFLYEDTYRTKSGEVKTVRYYQTPGTADHPRGMTVDEAGLRELGLRSDENRGSFMPATKEKESNLAEKYPDLNDIPKRHVPIEIEREDGSKYGAVMNGYYDLGGSKGSQPSVGRMIDGGWSHGMLRDGEKIVSPHPSPKQWDSQFSSASFMPTDQAKQSTRAHNPEVAEIADGYMKKAGLPYEPHTGYSKMPEELGKRLADWFDKEHTKPNEAEVQKSYSALKDQVRSQYDMMVKAGYSIEPWTGKGEPYKSSADMVRDVSENKHLYFFPTDNGFGSSEKFDVSKNPMLEPSGVRIGGKELLANDLFRAVHDFFGHAKEGYEFGPRGEYNAFLAHSTMFEPSALPALGAETLAQNAWVNFGPHLRRKDGSLPVKGESDFKPLADRPFADQKVTVVPQDLLRAALDAGKAPGKEQPVTERNAKFMPASRDDFSKDNISGLLGKKDWAILTAENPDGRSLSADENADRNAKLESELNAKGFEFVPVRGKYGDNEEHSYAITGIDSNAALALGRKYGQESVLTRKGFEYANGDVKPARGIHVFDSKPDNYYSTLPDGTTFQVDIDFDGANNKPLPEAVDRNLNLVHLSGAAGLTRLGTEYFGKGMAPTRDLKGLPKVYFFEEGSPVGGDNFWTKGRKMYGAEISGDKIYDGDKDALGYWKNQNREERDQMLIDKGYEGMAVKTADGRRTVSMFKDVDVKPLGTFEGGDKISAPVSKSTTSFAPRTPEQTAIATARAKANDYKERFPEAQPLTFAKDAEGHLKLDDEGKPRTVKTSYDLYNTPLAKQAGKGIKNEDKKSDAIAEAYSDGLVKQYDRIKDRPEVMAGANWYRVARTKIKSVFGDDSLLFAQLLGATSAQTPVADNFRQSIDAYRRFKAGDYDAMVTKYKEGLAKLADGSLMAESGAKTEPAAMKWWIDQHNLVPTKSNGKRFNANSHAVLRVLAGNWAETVAGPKTPNFAGNLAGTTLEATIDVWAARMLHRVGSEQEGKKWRILPDSETGVSDPDFYLGQAAYRKAAAKIGTNPDDLQAVLWFAEKDHWEKKGWTRGSGAEKSDFNYFLDRTKKEGDTAVLDEGKPKQEELAL